MYYTSNDFRLYHHGVRGQKWGVRRYQNADGSLTAAGRKRLAKDVNKLAKKHGRYSQEVQDRVNKDLTDEQRARVREASNRFSEELNSSREDHKKTSKLNAAIAAETDRLVADEMKRNPSAYKSERDYRKLSDAFRDLAEDNVFEKNPELFEEDIDRETKAYDKYEKKLREIGKSILKEYSDKPVNIPNSYKSDATDLIAFALGRIDYQQRQEEKNKK